MPSLPDHRIRAEATRALLRIEREDRRLRMTLGGTMPWPLYEAQNRRCRQMYRRRMSALNKDSTEFTGT